MLLSRISKQFVHTRQGLNLIRTATTSSISSGDNSSLPSHVKPFSEIPGPSGLYSIPYIGTALLFKPFTKFLPTEVTELTDSLKEKYGDVLKIRFGKDYLVFINHPEDAKTVLQANYEEHTRTLFELSEITAKRLGIPKGIVLLKGHEWAGRRKPAQEKMLRPAVVANYVPLIERVTNDFIEVLRQKGKIDDLQGELSNYTTESVGMLCFNKRLGCLEPGSNNQLALMISNAFELLQKSFFSPLKLFMYFKTDIYKRYEKEILEFWKFTEQEIKSQRAFLADIEKKGQIEEYLEKEPNFMYSLLADGRLSDDAINIMVADLFGAGIDSTANTMVFLLVDLATNKDKQEMLYEEIKRVVGDSPCLTKEHLAQMSYLKACLKESHRRTFPSSFGVIRILESDLVVGDYLLPKNTTVAVNMRAMSVDERFFPKPKEFIPERWLRDTKGELAKGKDYPFATKPFGFGPRSCIGQRFAENEIFIGVIKMIQNFEISMPSGIQEIQVNYKIFTTPKGKVQLHLKERN